MIEVDWEIKREVRFETDAVPPLYLPSRIRYATVMFVLHGKVGYCEDAIARRPAYLVLFMNIFEEKMHGT